MPKKPRAILFGSTTGHGAVMTAISERNLEKDYDVSRICKYVDLPNDESGLINEDRTDWGTGNPGLFWGITLPEFFKRTDLNRGDLVVIANIPIGTDSRFPSYGSDNAIACINALVMKGVTVQIIDHHKTSLSDYGKAHEAGAEIIISSSAITTHYGDPDEFSMFWGRIGAISDRDRGERYPKPLLKEEKLSHYLDNAVKQALDNTINAIKHNDIDFFTCYMDPIFVPEISPENLKTNVVFLPEVTTKEGFKQLGEACKSCKKNGINYAVGLAGEHPHLALLVVTNWEKYDVIPGALYLGLPKWKGHPDAFSEYCGQQDVANEKLHTWIDVLDQPFKPDEDYTTRAPHLTDKDSYYRDIALFMRSIKYPGYLTQHGWPHVQNVLANIRTLGSLFKVSGDQQKILDWAALLHDVGRGADKYYGSRIEEMKKECGADIDENHSHYSRAMILDWKKMGKFK